LLLYFPRAQGQEPAHSKLRPEVLEHPCKTNCVGISGAPTGIVLAWLLAYGHSETKLVILLTMVNLSRKKEVDTHVQSLLQVCSNNTIRVDFASQTACSCIIGRNKLVKRYTTWRNSTAVAMLSGTKEVFKH